MGDVPHYTGLDLCTYSRSPAATRVQALLQIRDGVTSACFSTKLTLIFVTSTKRNAIASSFDKSANAPFPTFLSTTSVDNEIWNSLATACSV
jgi:hypothetical protein